MQVNILTSEQQTLAKKLAVMAGAMLSSGSKPEQVEALIGEVLAAIGKNAPISLMQAGRDLAEDVMFRARDAAEGTQAEKESLRDRLASALKALDASAMGELGAQVSRTMKAYAWESLKEPELPEQRIPGLEPGGEKPFDYIRRVVKTLADKCAAAEASLKDAEERIARKEATAKNCVTLAETVWESTRQNARRYRLGVARLVRAIRGMHPDEPLVPQQCVELPDEIIHLAVAEATETRARAEGMQSPFSDADAALAAVALFCGVALRGSDMVQKAPAVVAEDILAVLRGRVAGGSR